MIRLSPILVVPTSWIVCCALLLPVAAQAECLQWDMSGRWEIVQGNGYNATFDLTQSGNELHGTGRYSEARSRSIDGSVGENGFDFTVHWSNGAIGYYAGGFSSDGGIASQSAYTYDKAHPGHRVYWDAPGRQAKCVKSAEATPAPPPAAPPPPPPAAPAPPAPVQPQGFAGIWDSKTGDGVSYTLTLDAQGSGSVGAVDARLDGTLQGGLSTDGKRLSFVMTQPGAGIVSRGQLSLSGDGNSFAGQITKDTDGIPRGWAGSRRP
jgi:hypothetical protein